ncbi:unnamed protein product, partial [Closterium sp. NIES-54]
MGGHPFTSLSLSLSLYVPSPPQNALSPHASPPHSSLPPPLFPSQGADVLPLIPPSPCHTPSPSLYILTLGVSKPYRKAGVGKHRLWLSHACRLRRREF